MYAASSCLGGGCIPELLQHSFLFFSLVEVAQDAS